MRGRRFELNDWCAREYGGTNEKNIPEILRSDGLE
jgi:hypothetical protein